MIAKIKLDEREYFSYIFFICKCEYRTKVIVYNKEENKFEFIEAFKNKYTSERVVYLFDYKEDDLISKKKITLNESVLEECIGYSWLIENIDLLNDIEAGIDVDEKYLEIARGLNSTIDVYRWHEVENQDDIDELLQIINSNNVTEEEVQSLSKCVSGAERPYVAILGGAKVSSKIKVIESLLTKVDYLIIGGAMAYTFSKAQGHTIGTSLCEDDQIDFANKCLEQGKGKLFLPIDRVISNDFENPTEIRTTSVEDLDIPEGFMGADIGPKTCELFADIIKKAKTVFWNGPMGIFEDERFAKGTIEVCKAITENQCRLIEAKAREAELECGYTVPSIAAWHIPTQEVFDVFEEKGYPVKEGFVLGATIEAQRGDFGAFYEKRWSNAASPDNFAERLKACGVNGVFVGHDHLVNTSVLWKDIRWTFGLKTGVYDYRPNGALGGTLIEIDNGEPAVRHIPSLVGY